jgi:transposase
MTTYMPFDREEPFLLPPDVKDWLPANDIAHFIVAAVERVRLAAFHTNSRPSGKPQYHPRLMLALLVYSLCQRRLLLAADRAGDVPGRRHPFYRRQHASRP